MYISYFDGRSSSKSFSWTNLPRRSFVSYFDILFSRLAVPFYFLTMPFLFSISRRSCFSPSCRSSMLPYSDVPVFLLRRSSFSSLDIPVIPTLPFLSVSLPCRSSVRYLAVLLFPALPFLCFETYRSSVLPYHAVPLLPISPFFFLTLAVPLTLSPCVLPLAVPCSLPRRSLWFLPRSSRVPASPCFLPASTFPPFIARSLLVFVRSPHNALSGLAKGIFSFV